MVAKIQSFVRDKFGNVSIITALALPVIVGLAGFGVETGLWYQINRTTQSQVDLAAYAGAVEIRNALEAGQSISDATTSSAIAAIEQLNDLGLFDGQDGVTLNVVSPPVNSPVFAGDTNAVEVNVSRNVPRIVSSLFTSGTVTQTFSAVARTDFAAPITACLVSLNPTGTSIQKSGSGTISLTGCEITANSVSPQSVTISGSGDINADCINTAGGFTESGSGNQNLACGGIRTNQTPVTDPYSNLAVAPDNLPCDNQGNISGSQPRSITAGPTGVRRLCTGLRKSGSGRLNIGPGTYIIEGSQGFDISGSGDISGDDVTFILRGNADFDKSGSGDLDFSAPNTGDFAGILFLDERSSGELDFTGSGRRLFEGVVYAPNSRVDFAGSGNLGANGDCLQIVAATIRLTGSSRLRGDCPNSGIRQFDGVAGLTQLVE